jgi:hypothetical protein
MSKEVKAKRRLMNGVLSRCDSATLGKIAIKNGATILAYYKKAGEKENRNASPDCLPEPK